MKVRMLAVIVCLPALALTANAEIFRCDGGDVVVFSDRPCDGRSRVYTPSGNMSVVASAPGLEEIAQRNREYLQSRRERRARQTGPSRSDDRLPILNVSGISGMLPDQQRSVRRTSREAAQRVSGGEATPRTTREATRRSTTETTGRTTREAVQRVSGEATRRTHGQR